MYELSFYLQFNLYLKEFYICKSLHRIKVISGNFVMVGVLCNDIHIRVQLKPCHSISISKVKVKVIRFIKNGNLHRT